MRFLSLVAVILTLAVAGAAWGDFEELPLKNAGLTWVLSSTSNTLATRRIEVGETKLLDQPSVGIMLEILFKGETIALVPSDFEVKSIDTATKNKEQQVNIELRSHYWGLPLLVYVDYWIDPRSQYQQKSINITPCPVKDAILKRVTIESMHFASAVQPIAPAAVGFSNEARSSFAAMDSKSARGLCFDLPTGKAELNRWRSLLFYEDANVPLEKGYTTGRMTIGAVTGKPEAAFKAYRQMLMDTRYPTLAKDVKLSALRKQFAKCFAECKYLPPCSEDGLVTAQGQVSANKGFILLFNAAAEARKVSIPLSNAGLGLSGELKLSDWSALEKPTDLGTGKPEDKAEIEVPAHGYRIVGVNIDG